MKLYTLLLLFLFCSVTGFSQIEGKVTNTSGEPLPYVNIYLENTFTGTTSNQHGVYELEIFQPGKYTLVFQFLGYETEKKEVEITDFPFNLNVTLQEEATSLDEVIVQSGANPAREIMENAIEKREFHKNKIKAYTADFYSRGWWQIKNAPESILGQEVGDLGGSLDSTRSGIVYLSETISKIAFRAPDNFKEKIIASKVSGNDNGFSLNSAGEAKISFYNNTVDLNSKLISPLADFAFNYYDFQLEGIFFNKSGKRINKIEVTPKRPNDRIFSGYIYIVHDSWQIYGIELTTTGEAMDVPPIEELVIKQNFNFSEEQEIWVPISQTVDFSFGIFGIKGNGRFIAAYSNYDFSPQFSEETFDNEILSFAPKANEKDSLFWQAERPVPLTLEERSDYIKKDSIQEYRNSEVYLDSVDRVNNKFNISDLLFGYTYSNSEENWRLSFGSPLFNTNVNTVQGYNSTLDISYHKNLNEYYNGSYWRIFSEIEYSWSEEKFRIMGGFQRKFNNFSKPILSVSGGRTVQQINSREPISETINAIATNFFERNYLKLYDLQFAKVSFEQEIFNGFNFYSALEYAKRSPLYNSWDSPWIDRDEVEFTSNNPLQPYNFNSAPFVAHEIYKYDFAAIVHFDQKYISYPSGKFNIPSEKYPVLTVNYEKGFASDLSEYNFDHLRAGLKQDFSIENMGHFGYNLVGGTFFNDEVVSYLDYRHFKGNQTHIGTSANYLDRFNLLPYYALSTKENYAEVHLEHDFRGWVLGKIPFVNRLNYSLILGAHQLYTAETSPYSEFSVGLDNLGIGKFRLLRLDYVVSHYEGDWNDGFIFGLKFLQVF